MIFGQLQNIDGSFCLPRAVTTRCTRWRSCPLAASHLFPPDAFPACAPAVFDTLGGLAENADFLSLPIIHDNGRHIWQQWFAEHESEREEWKEGKVYSDLAIAIEAAADGEGIFLSDEIICRHHLPPSFVAESWQRVP